SWHRDQKSKAASVFWPKQVEQSDNEDGSSGEFFGMRYTKIGEGRERADRGGHQIIGDEQKRADNGDDFAAMAHTGVDAAAIRIEAADNHVVESNERGEDAHQGDQPERSVTSDGEGETDDVGFARAPVAVQNRGGARCVHVARTLDVGWYQLIRPKRGGARATRRLISAG